MGIIQSFIDGAKQAYADVNPEEVMLSKLSEMTENKEISDDEIIIFLSGKIHKGTANKIIEIIKNSNREDLIKEFN